MKKLVLLQNQINAGNVTFQPVGLTNALLSVKFSLPSEMYNENPPNGDDNTQTVIDSGTIQYAGAILKTTHNGNATDFELTGLISSKRPHTGGGGLMEALKKELEKISDINIRLNIENVVQSYMQGA